MSRTSALFVAVASLVFAGCGASSDSPPGSRGKSEYADDATFTIGMVGQLSTFDPYHDPAVLGYENFAYDSLVNLRPDGEYVSGLAQEWTVTPTSATFTLHENVTCSDGDPLTASDVAAAISYVSDPANGSPMYGSHTPTVPLTATGDDASRTVEVTLAEPFGLLLESIGVLPIVCRTGLVDVELLKTSTQGTGPYVLEEIVAGQSVTLTRRDDYTWGPDGASTDVDGMPARVVLRTIANESTAANLLVSGELNMTKITGQEIQRLDAGGFAKLALDNGVSLRFNQMNGRLPQDERLRRALAHALNVEELVAVSTGGTGSQATGLVALGPRVCSDDTLAGHIPGYDPDQAAAILDDLGWVKGADGTRTKDGARLKLDLHYLTDVNPYDKPTAELIAEAWEAIGIQVNLVAENIGLYSKTAYETRDWDTYVAGYGFYLPSQWIPFASGAVPPDGSNFSAIENPAYNDFVRQAQGLTPPEACTYWTRAEQALFDQVNVLPISFRPFYHYLNNAEAEITGFEFPIPTSVRVVE